jgi:hypothetical protein
MYYQLKSELISSTEKTNFLIFPSLGKDFSIESVSEEHGIDLILSSKHHVREFPEHSHIGLLDMLYPKDAESRFSQELDVLKYFVRTNKAYSLTINTNAPISDCSDFIDKELFNE